MRRSCAVAIAAVCVASPALAATAHAEQRPVAPDAVLTWNTIAVDAVRSSTPAKFQTEGFIDLSYTQAAVYDAVTKIAGRYEPYHDFTARVTPGASPQAAVAAAARTVLNHYLPDRQPAVDQKYAEYIATLDGNVAGGVAVGEAAAQDLIALRVGDGRGAATPAYGTIGPVLPGQWQLQTPAQTAQTPWVATTRPFLLERPSEFRAEPPPSLGSRTYARDVVETQTYGSLASAVRTPEQTATAYFWNANNINQFNQTMQNVIREHDLDLVDAARLIAMGELVTTDAGIACFDSKYFYLAWRPLTAIHNAAADGNPDTTADPGWTPLLSTPNHPEYPSQHACLTSAFTEALLAALDTRRPRLTIPGSTNGGTTLTTNRTFTNPRDIQDEVADARIWIGFHFRFATDAGRSLGHRVARSTLDRSFRQIDRSPRHRAYRHKRPGR